MAYLCCPLNPPIRLDWVILDRLIRKLQNSDRRCLEVIGIDPAIISAVVATVRIRRAIYDIDRAAHQKNLQNVIPKVVGSDDTKLSKYSRFYTALLCVSLIRALPIELITKSFNVTFGDIQVNQFIIFLIPPRNYPILIRIIFSGCTNKRYFIRFNDSSIMRTSRMVVPCYSSQIVPAPSSIRNVQ